MMPRISRLAFIAFVAVGLLSACGKRGLLEPPPSQAEANNPEGEKRQDGNRKRVPIVPPKRDLPIDWILE